MGSVEDLVRLLEQSRTVVAITGAGMSTASGIPDFRSPSGLEREHSTEELLRLDTLRLDPAGFWDRFRELFVQPRYLYARPNPAHLALARLESLGRRVRIFTQNIDGLHQAAGSQEVYEMHGSLRDAVCPVCDSTYPLVEAARSPLPRCTWVNQKGNVCNHILEPDVVLYGQNVRYLFMAQRAIHEADLVLVLGTSLEVDPVADLPRYAAEEVGVPLAIVNEQPTYCDGLARVVLHDRLEKVLPEALERLAGAA